MDNATSIVVMGASGCGKSSVGAACAVRLGLPLVEGDDYHPSANVAKMRAGIPLTDDDRAGWLEALAGVLERAEQSGGVVLTCSALKRRYRDRLRAAAAGLRFVWLQLDEAEALRRVAQRSGHPFPPGLVADQFATLEAPSAEALVLTLDATLPVAELARRVADWVRPRPSP